jgi:hypothetical protein
MFTKPRLISIGLLLAILLISLLFSSYVEGLDNQSVADEVNIDAPKGAAPKDAAPKDAAPNNDFDGVTLGKPLTVADITGALQNNPGVQKMLDKPL